MTDLVRINGDYLVGLPVTLADGSKFVMPAFGLASADGSSVSSSAPLPIAFSGGVKTGLATYRASGTAYPGYATPTDLLTLRGAANKIIYVTAALIQIQTTAAALQTVSFIKRSTLNAGGTSTTPTPIPLDSGSAAASGVVNLYTAAPTLGNAVGNLYISLVSSSSLTNGPNSMSLFGGAGNPDTVTTDVRLPVTLRVNESLCLNYAGAVLTPGFSATWLLEWTEMAA